MIKTKPKISIQKTNESRIVERSREEITRSKLREFEDDILQKCLETVAPCLDFSKIDPQNQIHPAEWNNFPTEERERRMRLALAAWAPQKDAPVGIKLAFDTLNGIINARSKQEQGNKTLNIESATFINPITNYEIIDVE